MNLENVKLNLDTQLVLNVGYPMGKTNAPRAYNAIFSARGMNAIMLPVEIQKGDLPRFIDAVRTLNIHHLCPTMPHKADFIPLLDDVDPDSRLFNSVNAIRIDRDGTSHGVGMDGKGAIRAMLDCGVDFHGRDAMLLGTGGISGVIGLELARQGIRRLTVLNRTLDKADTLARILNENTGMKVESRLATAENLDQAADGAEIFIQATPLGMAGYSHTHPYLGFIDRLPETAAVLDVIINPPDTTVIARARARQLKTVPGMLMLASQMGEIFKFLFDVTLSQGDKDACIQELCSFLGVPLPVADPEIQFCQKGA